jgi:[ribosomal protein S18]-alanine N-acetyltransferase
MSTNTQPATVTPEIVRVQIRWLIRRDYPEVLAIERVSFENPWTEKELLHYMLRRNVIGMVCELREQVIGYMIYELEKTRLDVTNFAVHPEWRFRGIGRQMVQKLISKLSSHRRTSLRVTVGEWNTAAHLFFRSQGFTAVLVERNHFPDTDQDAYRFVYRLTEDS